MLTLYTNLSARLRRDEKGATAVEYGIMVALIAVVIIVAVTLLGGSLNEMFESVQCQIEGGTYKGSVEESGTVGQAGYVAAADATCTPAP